MHPQHGDRFSLTRPQPFCSDSALGVASPDWCPLGSICSSTRAVSQPFPLKPNWEENDNRKTNPCLRHRGSYLLVFSPALKEGSPRLPPAHVPSCEFEFSPLHLCTCVAHCFLFSLVGQQNWCRGELFSMKLKIANKSLSALGNVISALAEGTVSDRVPSIKWYLEKLPLGSVYSCHTPRLFICLFGKGQGESLAMDTCFQEILLIKVCEWWC